MPLDHGGPINDRLAGKVAPSRQDTFTGAYLIPCHLIENYYHEL